MKHRLDQQFSIQQIKALKEQIWWVGQQTTPYIVKATVYNNNLLIMISNLKTLWTVKKSSDQLWDQKSKYAKTLQINKIEGLLKLFQSLLVNPEKKAQYTFKTIEHSSGLRFQISKDIEVYPFVWHFNLQQKDKEMVQLFCQQILNPLIYTLNCQQRRINLLKKKFQNLQKDYIKRLSQGQKNMFRSQVQQSQQDWKMFMPDANKQYLLDIKLDPSSKFFFQYMIKQQKQKKSNLHISPRPQKITRIIQGQQNFQPQQFIRVEQLQKLQQQTKKGAKKKLDFL